MSLLLIIENLFPVNNLSLLRPIDAILCVLIVYAKRQPGIATQMFVIKVKVTVAKNRKQVLAKYLKFSLAY